MSFRSSVRVRGGAHSFRDELFQRARDFCSQLVLHARKAQDLHHGVNVRADHFGIEARACTHAFDIAAHRRRCRCKGFVVDIGGDRQDVVGDLVDFLDPLAVDGARNINNGGDV